MESDDQVGGRTDGVLEEIHKEPSVDDGQTTADTYWPSVTAPRLQLLDSLHRQPYTPEHFDRAYRAVELEIQAIEKSMLAARRRLNAFRPIARLPPEVLAHVFLLLADMEPHFYPDPADFPRLTYRDESFELQPCFGWIRVTHVCFHWREVALAHAHLWSNVTFSLGPDWAQEFLQRSKQAPVLIDYWDPDDLSPWLAPRMIEDNVHRIHTIHVISYRSSLDDFHPFSSPAPLLHTFRVHSTLEDFQWRPSRISEETLPLQILSLYGVRDIPWRQMPSIARNLTSLSIHHSFYFSPLSSLPHPSLSEIIEALRQMQSLEVLEIQGPLPSRPIPDGQPAHIPFHEPVSIPRLAKLSLGGPIRELSAFVPFVCWGPATMVRLDAVAHENTAPEAVRAAFAHFKAHLPQVDTRLRDNHVVRVASKDTPDHRFADEVSVWTQDRSSDTGAPDFAFSVDMHRGHYGWYRNMEVAPLVLPLDSMRTLRVSDDKEYSALVVDQWSALFSQSPDVTSVDAMGNSAIFLTERLLAWSPAPHPEHTPRDGGLDPPESGLVLFPKLETLVLRNALYNVTWEGSDVAYHRRMAEYHVGRRLRKLVEIRAKGRCPLKTVFLDAYLTDSVANPWVAELAKFVEVMPIPEAA